jgi:hypothetical protein
MSLVVWYNTRCPVCDAGIGRQRSKLVESVRAGLIEFRDINLSRRCFENTEQGLRMCVGACMRPMALVTCLLALTFSSRCGVSRLEGPGLQH